MIILQNNDMEIGFSECNGSLNLLKDRKRDITYIHAEDCDPFRITTEDGMIRTGTFTYALEEGKNACRFHWSLGEGASFHARAELHPQAGEVAFTSGLDVEAPITVMDIEYPIIGHIDNIGDADKLAHPYATGVLVDRPMETFAADGKGFRFMPYPESFSGATMQFFSYYAEGKGGLYFAAYDAAFHLKWLNFYKNYGKLEASLIYGCEDIGAGKGCKADWPFVIRTIDGAGWYEACDLYKAWAVNQKWCAEGPLCERDSSQMAKWLYEDIGLATFGIDASYDRTKWIREYGKTTGSRIFHILGPDWAATAQDYYNHIPAGIDEWLPTRFHQKNLDCIREQGDKFAPFEFNFLVEPEKAQRQEVAPNIQMMPRNPRSLDTYPFKLMCPGADATRKLHLERDPAVLRESGADAIYYDISANNILMSCMSAGHHHPVGGGASIVQAYKDIYALTKDALHATSGKYVPMGTELISEPFLDNIDFYQARGWAQPCSALETHPFRSGIKNGNIGIIPMFTYVYHEYGPLRLDGWGKLVREIGEYFYHTAAKVYLWGGVYELNYEFGPMEAVGGTENDPAEHYYEFDKKGYAFDPGRAAYLSQLAALRTSHANKYLAYGMMQRPLTFTNPTVRLDWYHYNSNKLDAEYEDGGIAEVPAIVDSAWRYGNGQESSLAFLFINTTDAPLPLSVDVDIRKYQMEGKWKIRLMTDFRQKEDPAVREWGEVSSGTPRNIRLELLPRKAYMIEIYH